MKESTRHWRWDRVLGDEAWEEAHAAARRLIGRLATHGYRLRGVYPYIDRDGERDWHVRLDHPQWGGLGISMVIDREPRMGEAPVARRPLYGEPVARQMIGRLWLVADERLCDLMQIAEIPAVAIRSIDDLARMQMDWIEDRHDGCVLWLPHDPIWHWWVMETIERRFRRVFTLRIAQHLPPNPDNPEVRTAIAGGEETLAKATRPTVFAGASQVRDWTHAVFRKTRVVVMQGTHVVMYGPRAHQVYKDLRGCPEGRGWALHRATMALKEKTRPIDGESAIVFDCRQARMLRRADGALLATGCGITAAHWLMGIMTERIYENGLWLHALPILAQEQPAEAPLPKDAVIIEHLPGVTCWPGRGLPMPPQAVRRTSDSADRKAPRTRESDNISLA